VLKPTLILLAFALAGTASAAGWKSLRVDASSEDAFEQSLEVFKAELSLARRHVFGEALKDIWIKGSLAAEAEQREYTAEDYHREVHGLTYEEVVNLTDPTGDTAKARYRQAKTVYPRTAAPASAANWGSRPTNGWGTSSSSHWQQVQQCNCAAPNGPQGN